MVEIIQAGIEDYKVVHHLAARVWPDTYLPILSAEQVEYMFAMMYSREAYTSQITHKNHSFLLAKVDNVFLGFASYELDYKPDSAKIHKIYILPEAQGKGAGKALISAIENIALQNNNRKLLLNVNRYNPAIHFYLKAGFATVGEEDINIGNGYLMEDYIMQKEL
jgi:GNAT superfamily N-acetyltransferase